MYSFEYEKKISTCLTSVSLAKHGLLSCIVNVQDLVENKRGKRKDLNEKQKTNNFTEEKSKISSLLNLCNKLNLNKKIFKFYVKKGKFLYQKKLKCMKLKKNESIIYRWWQTIKLFSNNYTQKNR